LLAFGVLAAHASSTHDAVSRSMVSAFFVLSGFLMQLTLSAHYGRNPLPFYWNRLLRVYPCYWLAVVGVALCFPSYAMTRFATGADLFGAITLTLGGSGRFVALNRPGFPGGCLV
jgi:peptidoglycan/LPS O-acetylase OafA/YrhL